MSAATNGPERFGCTHCTNVFPTQTILQNHLRRRHNPIAQIASSLSSLQITEHICNLCNRRFPSERALESHTRNPGRQHSGRSNPCMCPVLNLSVTEAHRAADGFIYKVILKCKLCGRSPMTVPLPADREMAMGIA